MPAEPCQWGQTRQDRTAQPLAFQRGRGSRGGAPEGGYQRSLSGPGSCSAPDRSRLAAAAAASFLGVPGALVATTLPFAWW